MKCQLFYLHFKGSLCQADVQDILGSQLGGKHILGNSHVGIIVICKCSSHCLHILACASQVIPVSHHFHQACPHPANHLFDTSWC